MPLYALQCGNNADVFVSLGNLYVFSIASSMSRPNKVIMIVYGSEINEVKLKIKTIRIANSIFCLISGIKQMSFLVIAVDSLLNETELEIVVYSGQLDLIVDTLGQSHFSHYY